MFGSAPRGRRPLAIQIAGLVYFAEGKAVKTVSRAELFDVDGLPGRSLEFEYPTHNRFGVPLEYMPRRICVESAERLSAPLSIADFIKRPFVRRGAVLITGVDVDFDSLNYGKREQFYLEAMKDGGELASFQLGLYDPDEPEEMVDFIGRVFHPSFLERQLMLRAVERFTELVLANGEIELQLGAWRASP